MLGVLAALAAPVEAAPRFLEFDESDPETVQTVSLPEALRLAAKHHPDLGPQRARVALAKSEVARAKAGALPRGEILSVFGVANGARIPDPESLPPGTPPELAPLFSTDGQNDLLNDLGPFSRNEVRIDQPLYTFGKIRSGRAAAQAGVQAEKSELDRRTSELRLEVRRIFYGHLLAKQMAQTLEEVAGNFQDAADQAEARLDAGEGGVSQADVLKLQIGLAGIRKQVVDLRQQEQESLWAFRRAIGRPLDAPVKPEGDRIRPVAIHALDEVESLAALVEALPAFEAARHGLRARQQAVAAAKAGLWPDIFATLRLEANWALTREQPQSPFVHDPLGFNIVRGGPFLGLRWPLDVASRLAEVEKAKARLAEQQARMDKARSGLPLQIRRAYLAFEAAQEKLKMAEGQRKKGRALSFLTAANFRLGIGEGQKILEAYGLYARTLGEYYRAIFDHNMAAGALSEAVGRPLERWNADSAP